MNGKKCSFIIEFDEIAKKQIDSLTDFFNNNKIKIQVLKSNYDLKKQEKLQNALDEIENILNACGEMACYTKSRCLLEEDIDDILEIIKKAKGE